MKHYISLGAGVQSSTMALMAAAGEIEPMPDAAIFADTQAEPASVYRWLDWLEKQLPFPVYRVTQGNLTNAFLTAYTHIKTGKKYYRNLIPAFIKNPNGSIGIVHRGCTYDYKVTPIHRNLRELAQIKRGQKEVSVVQWIGISLDEIRRMKPCRKIWCISRWPLVEMRMTRHLCLEWMRTHGYPEPPRSACIYCPFHNNEQWRRLQTEEPEAFAEAVRVEKEIQILHHGINNTRAGKINGIPFLHRSCQPLDTVDFRDDFEKGQLPLWMDECEGMCGV